MSLKPCILPWINFGTNPYGRPRPCGYSNQDIVGKNEKIKNSSVSEAWNSEYFKSIRRDFLAGKWPENCSRCMYVEEKGGISKRMDENNRAKMLLEVHDVDYFSLIDKTTSAGYVSHFPISLDMRVGTICTLKCIHCGTGCSSKWYEDKELLDKYSNTTNYNVDNKWIEHESFIWDNIIENIDHIERLSFLGGEAFANKQHNNFLRKLSTLDARKKITVHYVTNATLITEQILKYLSKIKMVELAVSLDAPELAGEFFRFPLKWKNYMETLNLISNVSNVSNVVKSTGIASSIQWTCSNISMFYLIKSYNIIKNNFSNLTFWLCNHVESPLHMSAKVLPMQLKEKIYNDIDNYVFDELCQERKRFYIDHMMEEDLWPTEGKVFMNYLDDLSKARNIDWRINLKEMELDRYDPR